MTVQIFTAEAQRYAGQTRITNYIDFSGKGDTPNAYRKKHG